MHAQQAFYQLSHISSPGSCSVLLIILSCLIRRYHIMGGCLGNNSTNWSTSLGPRTSTDLLVFFCLCKNRLGVWQHGGRSGFASFCFALCQLVIRSGWLIAAEEAGSQIEFGCGRVISKGSSGGENAEARLDARRS